MAEENSIEEDDLISQEDIDALLASDSSDDKSDTEDEEVGELSQDDIDSLLNSNSLAPEADAPDEEKEGESGSFEPDDTADDTDDFSELISQDDINALIGNQNGDDLADAGAGEGEAAAVAAEKDDIVVEDEAPEGNDTVTEDDPYRIDASEAVGVQDCLITQETLDELASQPDQDPDAQQESESLDLDLDTDSIGQELDLGDDDSPDPLPDQAEESPLDDSSAQAEEISQDDIDALLSEDDDELDEGVDADSDIMADLDVDTGGSEESREDDEILISQDDIDALLMSSDQEDEDVLGNLLDDDDDGIDSDAVDEFLDDEDDLDDFSDDLSDDMMEDEEDDTVVLEGLDDDPDSGKTKKSKKSGPSWYRSKRVFAAAGILLIIVLSVPVAYKLFFSSDTAQNDMQTESVPAASSEREIIVDSSDTVDITVGQARPASTPGSLVLKDFIILASDDSDALSYVATDISIDYSNESAYNEINENMPFYRGLIYDSIQQALSSERKDDITESDLARVVEAALKTVLPGDFIDSIRFDSFKTG